MNTKSNIYCVYLANISFWQNIKKNNNRILTDFIHKMIEMCEISLINQEMILWLFDLQ
jgi:hypothetical protein